VGALVAALAVGEPFVFGIFLVGMRSGRIVPHRQFTSENTMRACPSFLRVKRRPCLRQASSTKGSGKARCRAEDRGATFKPKAPANSRSLVGERRLCRDDNVKQGSRVKPRVKRAGETPALPFAKGLWVNSVGIHEKADTAKPEGRSCRRAVGSSGYQIMGAGRCW
jgi:hypothetical protein